MYQQHTLENGLKILMVPVPTYQSISVGFFVAVGSRYETDRHAGISHFIEHMLFKGTPTLPNSGLIAEAIEGIGGSSNAYTSQDSTVYYAKVAASQAATAIEYLTDLLRHSLFAAADIKKEKQVINEEISMVFDQPDTWVSILADQLLWPDHPLGYNIAGSPESLARITRKSLLEFFQRSYHPANLLVAVGGAFNPDDIVAQLSRLLGDWQPAPLPPFKAAPLLQTAARCQIEPRPIEQGHLCLTLPCLSRSHPDRFALSVLNTVLGDGMSSRLFLNIREDKGLAYAIDSGLNLLQDTGSLEIYAGVDPDRAAEALQAILLELERLRQEPVSARELRRAKEYLKGRLVLSLEDTFSRASWVAYQALFMPAIKSSEEVLAAYDAVSADEVQTVAQSTLNPSRYNLAAIGPFARPEALSQLIIK